MATFNFLDIYYSETKDDTLGMLLGSLNPFVWVDPEPNNPNICSTGDPAAWEDWVGIVRKFTNKNQLDSEQAFRIMIEFLKFYKDDFDYAPGWLIEELAGKSHDTPKWLDCIAASISM